MESNQAKAFAEIPHTEDAHEFLLAVMNHPGVEMETRIEAAAVLMPYHHERLTDDEDEND